MSDKIKCPHCDKEYSKKGIGTHIWRAHTEKGKEFTKTHDPNKGYKDGTREIWNKGLTKETNESVKRTGEKIKKILSGRKLSELHKCNLSISMKNSDKVGGYRKGSGRGKHGWYKGYWCDSSYELVFVIYNIEHNITFTRNTQGFKYAYENNTFNYFPDFIMEDGNYIEIKGYEDAKCFAKYQQFPYKLTVLKLENLQIEFQYVLAKYGNDFINLYET